MAKERAQPRIYSPGLSESLHGSTGRRQGQGVIEVRPLSVLQFHGITLRNEDH